MLFPSAAGLNKKKDEKRDASTSDQERLGSVRMLRLSEKERAWNAAYSHCLTFDPYPRDGSVVAGTSRSWQELL